MTYTPEEADVDILVIGIGNEYRRDDSIGLILARKIRALDLPGVVVRENDGNLTTISEWFKESGCVVMIDAVSSNSPPGTLHRFDVGQSPLPSDMFRFSTHTISIADLIELCRALNYLPRRLIVFGIEVRDFNMGNRLSPELDKCLPRLLEQLVEDITDIQRGSK